MFIIYHNPRCKKSRAGLAFLSQKTDDFQIKEYLSKDAFTNDSLKEVLNLLNKKPMEMIRKQEEFFKKEMKSKNFSDEELLHLMVENPKLIQRPIVIKGRNGVWGDPAENIHDLL